MKKIKEQSMLKIITLFLDMRKIFTIAIATFSFFIACCASNSVSQKEVSLVKTQAHCAYSNLDYNKPISSTREISPILPTFLVMPAKNENLKTMADAINNYLTKKNYEVKSLEGQTQIDNLIKIQNDIANTEDDLFYLTSLSLGAEIFIKFSGSIQSENVSIEVNAYESSTGRLLGTQTAEVKNNGYTDQVNIRAHIQSVARKAMPSLEKKILAYWEKDLEKGLQYKVVMNIKGSYTNSQLEEIHEKVLSFIKNSFNHVTVNILTGKTIDIIIYADSDKYSDSQEVYSFIRNSLIGFIETKKLNISKKLILMDLL